MRRPGIELTSSRLHSFIVAKVSHAFNHSVKLLSTPTLKALRDRCLARLTDKGEIEENTTSFICGQEVSLVTERVDPPRTRIAVQCSNQLRRKEQPARWRWSKLNCTLLLRWILLQAVTDIGTETVEYHNRRSRSLVSVRNSAPLWWRRRRRHWERLPNCCSHFK